MMNLVQILLIIVIVTFLVLFLTRMIASAKQEEVEIEYVPQQHPIYPFVQHDIREVLAPSRRTYMRYPYYATRYGIFMR